MKIRTKLQVITFVAIALAALAFGLINTWIWWRTDDAIDKSGINNQVTKDVFQLNVAANDYLQHHEVWAQTQWEDQYNSLTKKIEQIEVSDAREGVILERIRRNLQDIGDRFNQLVEASEAGADSGGPGPSLNLEERLAARLSIRSQSVASDAFQLAKLSLAAADDTRRQGAYLMAGSGIVIALLVATSLYFIGNSVIRSITKLRDGTRVIASGDLDHAVDITSTDEIGQLGSSFNDMAHSLRTSYEAVQQESAQRKDIAEQLSVLNESLEQRIVERTREISKINSELESEIAERKEVEEELIRLAAIVESSDDAIFGKSLDGIITSWNSGAQRIYGYLPEEVIDGPVSLLVPPSHPDEVPNILATIRRGEHVDNFETVRQTKNGSLINVALTISPVKNAAGDIIAASTIARDITQRVEAETAEHRRSEEMATLFSVANILAQTSDFEDNLTELVASLAQITTADHVSLWVPDEKEQGLTLLASVGSAVQDLTPPVLSYTESVSGPAFQKGEPVIVNDYPSHPLASALAVDRGVRSLISLPLSARGDTIGVVVIFSREAGFFTDERVRFLTTVVSGLGTLLQNARLSQAIEKHAVELARSNAELEQFAYVASHDLQEPLRSIAGFTGLLERRYRGKLGEDADRFVTRIVVAVGRMQQLINDLLTYSRVGRGLQELTPTDSEALVREEISNLQAAITESEAVVSLDQLPTVTADGPLLGQVVRNLIGNAIKYKGKEAPRVHIAAKQQDNEWVFSVRDNGIGIEPQYNQRIFNIFQRLHTREEYAGTGIGLSICKKAVDYLGGRIWVESELGKGSTFYFTVPLAGNQKEAARAPAGASES